MTPFDLQQLGDREAIRDVVLRYCRAVDRCDAQLLQSVYWPDATDSHGYFDGSADEFVRVAIARLRSHEQTQHMVGNMLIELDGARAAVETYVHSYHRLRGPGANPQDVFIGARYLDRMERRGAEWRIAERRVVYDWFRFLEGSADWTRGLLGDPLPMGARESDLSYAVLRAR
jgi:hypothetical protein